MSGSSECDQKGPDSKCRGEKLPGQGPEKPAAKVPLLHSKECTEILNPKGGEAEVVPSDVDQEQIEYQDSRCKAAWVDGCGPDPDGEAGKTKAGKESGNSKRCCKRTKNRCNRFTLHRDPVRRNNEAAPGECEERKGEANEIRGDGCGKKGLEQKAAKDLERITKDYKIHKESSAEKIKEWGADLKETLEKHNAARAENVDYTNQHVKSEESKIAPSNTATEEALRLHLGRTKVSGSSVRKR